MKKIINSIIAGVIALSMAVAFTACGGNEHNFSDKWSSDATSHWHDCTDEGCKEKDALAAHVWGDDGKCTVCNYVKAGGGEETGDFAYSEYLVSHTKGESATYIFEAENTDLGGKTGPDWSGAVSGDNMVIPITGASHGAGIWGLCSYGMSVNFIVVCDEDVENASLKLYLGARYIDVDITSATFTVRVDGCTDEDLLDAEDGGAVGNWDKFFLQHYKNPSETGGYFVSSWECGEVSIKKPAAQGETKMGDSAGYLITNNLKLKKGVNCISLITNNTTSIVGTTMTAIAPVVDCISITTTAQLGMYININSGYGKDGCWIK